MIKLLDIIELFSQNYPDKSRTEIKILLKSGGLYVNDKQEKENRKIEFPEDFLHGQYVITRIGKRNYAMFSISKRVEGEFKGVVIYDESD